MKEEIGLWAIIKETRVDDIGLTDFYNKFFSFPIYRDENLATYKAFGNRKIALSTWNPLRLYTGFKSMSGRLKEKKIEGNYVGEGLVQGGILIFDAKGKLPECHVI
jgi:hypothetical protein